MQTVGYHEKDTIYLFIKTEKKRKREVNRGEECLFKEIMAEN